MITLLDIPALSAFKLDLLLLALLTFCALPNPSSSKLCSHKGKRHALKQRHTM